jgi:hypothetical protein
MKIATFSEGLFVMANLHTAKIVCLASNPHLDYLHYFSDHVIQ